MNEHERRAWRLLVELGARQETLGGKAALNLSTIRAGSQRRVSALLAAFHEVVGRSGANRHHVNRRGEPVFVVTDDNPASPNLRPPPGARSWPASVTSAPLDPEKQQ